MKKQGWSVNSLLSPFQRYLLFNSTPTVFFLLKFSVVFIDMENLQKNQVVYTLSSSEDPNRIKYIGRTRTTLEIRLKNHFKEARSTRDCMFPKNVWIRDVIANGYEVVITPVMTVFTSFEDLKWFERDTIKWYRDNGHDILNSTFRSEHSLLFTTKSQMGEKNNFFGKKHTDETKKKISEWKKGKKLNDETKKKISDSHRKKLMNPDK